ncbi:hypothetical protein BDL97_06G120400 [Sphagnum fallax]|nr:hypothetical protein BDL97_06G120400 [Sphagnum fallax]
MMKLMEYSYLLDMADEWLDPYVKMVYAASWAVSVYPAYQQTWKLFNPILGETYEMENHNGVTFLAEHETTLFLQMLYNGWFKRQFTQELMLQYFDMMLDVAKKVHDYGQHADFIKDCKALDSTLDRELPQL